MAIWVRTHRPGLQFWCPQLPPSPAQAMALVADTLAHWPPQGVAIMGSSLGGFYATWVAEQLPAGQQAQVVLVNPAVEPARDLARYIGEQTSWHNPQERFFFQPGFVDELIALGQPPLTHTQRYQTWAATGDEVLDWREMQARYATTRCEVVPGSDHALSDFDDHLPQMLRHLGLT